MYISEMNIRELYIYMPSLELYMILLILKTINLATLKGNDKNLFSLRYFLIVKNRNS